MAVKLSAAVIIFFRVVEILILLRIILSWIPFKREYAIVRFVFSVTEPILAPIRNLIARSSVGKNMMFDFSPILAYIILGILQRIILMLIAKI